MKIGFTMGVFDLFHIGHVRLLKNASAMCDQLIVGVMTDEMVREYKSKSPVIPIDQRLEVVASCRYVDVAVAQATRDKIDAWHKYKFDVMFMADNWFRDEKFREAESALAKLGARVVYFPYTEDTSSTMINDTLEALRKEPPD